MAQVSKSIAVHAPNQLSMPVKDLQTRLLALFEVAELLDNKLNLCCKGHIEALAARINDCIKLYARFIRWRVPQMG